MSSAEQHFLDGLAHHKAGRLNEAQSHYRTALELDPKHFAALQHRGAILADGGALGEAAALFERAAHLRPSDPVIFYQLASTLSDLERHEEALAAFDAAIALKPDIPRLHAGRGSALQALNRPGDAIAAYDAALKLRPSSPDVLVLRGLARSENGETEKALADFSHALTLRPDDSATLDQLALALWNAAAYDLVLEATSQGLARDPSRAEPYALRAGAQFCLGRYEAAIADASAAIAKDPALAAGWHNRANTYVALNRFEEALSDSERAVKLAPHLIEAAATRFTAAACLCDFEAREKSAADLLRLRGSGHLNHPFPLFYLADDPALHLESARAAAGPARVAARPISPREKLRIGYMSPDFRDHVVAHQIVEVLERHDRGALETVGICLFAGEKPPLRDRIVKAFDRFIEAGHLGDLELARRIAALDLDILVDLAGGTAMGRTRMLAHRPAPVIVSFLGFPGTSGASYVDYIVADGETIPPEAEEFYSEKIARLPMPFMPRDTTVPAGPAPSRTAAGLPADGIVFGAFSNSYKIERDVFAVWMRLLKSVPDSVLWFSLGNKTAQTNLRREAAAQDVAPERLVFAERIADRAAYLGRLKLIDVFLDTRCYGAHATASDLLWAGVPMVTLPGKSFATRVGAGMLRAAGLGEWIAADLSAYEHLARRLATDPSCRSEFRAHLENVRPQLFDMNAYTRALESAYRIMAGQCREDRRTSFTVALP